MKIIISEFNWLKEKMPYYKKKYEGYDPFYLCTVISASSGVPVLAVMTFYEELYSTTEEFTRAKNNIIEFYGYDQIIR